MTSDPDAANQGERTARDAFPVGGTVLAISLTVVGAIVGSVLFALGFLACIRWVSGLLSWPVEQLLWASCAVLVVLGLIAAAFVVVFALRALHESIENESARSEALLDQLAIAEDPDPLAVRRKRPRPPH